MSKKVSIITPVYNSEDYLEQTIQSVLEQTYPHWELVLVDDASTDSSASIIEKYKKQDQRIRGEVLKSNQGAAVARNRATELATGDFIAFLDSDDLWKPHKLETQLKAIETADADVCFSSYDLMDEDSMPLHKRVTALPELHYSKLLKSNYIGNLTGMYRAERLGKIMVPNLKRRQDWLLWIEALKRSAQPAIGISESLANYRLRNNSISSNKIKLLKYNYWVYKKGLNYSSIAALFKLSVFLCEHFFIKPKQVVSTKTI